MCNVPMAPRQASQIVSWRAIVAQFNHPVQYVTFAYGVSDRKPVAQSSCLHPSSNIQIPN